MARRTAAAAVALGAVAAAAAAPAADTARNVGAFFYSWYGTPDVDGKWLHWNHSILRHWTPSVDEQYPHVSFAPPHDIHAPFYPARGLYSSRDPAIARAQFAELRAHGVGFVVISWWGRPGVSAGDSQGVVNDDLTGMILDAAEATGMKVALHLEPYAGRTVESVRDDLAHIVDAYGAHPALLRLRPRRYVNAKAPSAVPVLFVYDSYHLEAREWERLLGPVGPLSVRGTRLDGVFIGLWLEAGHGHDLAGGGFDGAYSYFATDGFSYGATTTHWAAMAAFCAERSMLFVPSVAPGYDDSRIRPWNAGNRRDREGGAYYRRMWDAALASGAEVVSITSANEWGEGTQIEPAVPRRVDVDALAPKGEALPRDVRAALGIARDEYLDYTGAGGPHAYLDLTLEYARKLHAARGLPDPVPPSAGEEGQRDSARDEL